MKRYATLLGVTCMLLSLYACTKGEIDSRIQEIVLKEGGSGTLKINEEQLSVRLLAINILFNEGVVTEKFTTFHRVYSVIFSIGNDTLQLNTAFERINEQPFKERSPDETFRAQTVTYQSHQVGVAHLYPESGTDSSSGTVAKLLVKDK